MTAADLNVAARAVLLDALEALGCHVGAVVLVGAQAIYLRTDSRDLSFAASFTSDADLTLDPRRLGPLPLLEEAMRSAGFTPANPDRPGIWERTVIVAGAEERVTVDLLIPEALAGRGTRAATLKFHGRKVATRAVGLEAALADHSTMTVAALDPDDHRRLEVAVAGLPALLIAKAHKLHERITAGDQHRIQPKDAADIYRILLALDPMSAGPVLTRLTGDDLSAAVTETGLEYLDKMFGAPARPGTALAVRALEGDVDGDQVRQVCVTVTRSLQRR